MQEQLKEVLNKQVTRKEFLQKAGLVFLAVLGLPAIIGVLTGGQKSKNLPGYGMSDYGP